MKPEYITQYRIGGIGEWSNMSHHRTLYKAKRVVDMFRKQSTRQGALKYRVIKVEVVA